MTPNTLPQKKNITSIPRIIPKSVTYIENHAFLDCTSLAVVEIPDQVTSIGVDAFKGCKNLGAVVLPESLTEIGGDAFYGCKKLWHVMYKGTEDQWNEITISGGNTRLKNAARHNECTGHELELKFIVEPTCTEKGTLNVICSLCGERCYNIPAAPLGHQFVNGVCQRCQEVDMEALDVNGDGAINARDARQMLLYIAGLSENVACDFNGDGRINARDARAILRYIAGLE